MRSNSTPPDHTQLDILTAPARARSADPSTSKQAAASVSDLRASHQRVLAMFKNYGDMTDETLGEFLDQAARETGFKRMSPSGVRSRRSELSKPNMDRLDEIAAENMNIPFTSLTEGNQNAARNQLRREGFKSQLWDTGKRERMSTGRQAIVWGLAR
jgi:hypothetical protein